MPDDLRVCFVGDSFVAGAGDPEHLGWAGRLAARTDRGGRPLTSYVLGVRRQTSAEIAARWQRECAPRLPAGCDGRVVVSFGVNDTTVEDGRQRVEASDSAAHLDAVLHDARASGWPVLVVGPPPIADTEQNAHTAVVDERLRRVCAAQQIPYVHALTVLQRSPVWMREVATGDGAHPGAAGYRLLADLVEPAWQQWLAG